MHKIYKNSQKLSEKLLIFIKIEEKTAIFADFWSYFYQKVLFLLKMHKNTLKKCEKSEKLCIFSNSYIALFF